MTEISKEYAEALFALACETGEENETAAALEMVAAQFNQYPEYMELLSSPGISLRERMEVISRTLSGTVPEYVASWMQLLCEKGRISLFSRCLEDYRVLLNTRNACSNAKVTSAVPLTQEEMAALKQKLEKISGNTVLLSCTTDPALLGGAVVEMDGKIIDGSLRHRLHEVKEVMNQ